MNGSATLSVLRAESANLALQFIIGNLAEKLCQRHDVFLTITQRRNGYLEVVQTVQQVLPETLFIDRLFQILVGGSDNTDIETSIRPVTNGAVSPLLYGAQKHLLGFRCEVAHFVQKQRAAFGFMEISFLGTVRTR